MKKIILGLLCTALAPAVWADAYNQNITAIFGSGNPNTGWTTDTGSGITLGLRAKNRTNGDTTNVNGVYSYATAPAPRGLWNFEFSINSGTPFLSYYDYYLSVDRDSSAGINYATVTPLSYWFDNSFGSAATANGAGFEPANPADYASYPGSYAIAQNSQNITFNGVIPYPGGGLALENNATYNYELFAVAKGGGEKGARLVDVGIQVVVGRGGAAVPDSASTLALLGLGLAGLVGLRARKQRA